MLDCACEREVWAQGVLGPEGEEAGVVFCYLPDISVTRLEETPVASILELPWCYAWVRASNRAALQKSRQVDGAPEPQTRAVSGLCGGFALWNRPESAGLGCETRPGLNYADRPADTRLALLHHDCNACTAATHHARGLYRLLQQRFHPPCCDNIASHPPRAVMPSQGYQRVRCRHPSDATCAPRRPFCLQ